MSSGMKFMYGHIFGAHSKKPHMDTVRAIRNSNTNPYITAPFGVDPSISQPGPRHTPFLEIQEEAPVPAVTSDSTDAMNFTDVTDTSSGDIDDIINMISSDPELSAVAQPAAAQPVSTKKKSTKK